jgi:hypothetical protein
MVRYEFPSMVAKDPTLDVTVRNAMGLIYGMLDYSFSTPLTVFDRYGSPKSTVRTTPDGQTEEFYVDDSPVVWWVSGTYAFLISSYTGMLAACQSAQASAASAAVAAQAAAADAEAALAALGATSDTTIANAINGAGTLSRAAVIALIASQGTSSLTADTGEAYKALLFSNGTVRAVPASATAPPTPANLAAVASASAAKLTWNVSAGATRYIIYRNGAQLATTTGTSYRDSVGVSGGTFTYRVAAVNGYDMYSPLSATVSAYLDPALNIPPTVAITTWPATIPTTGRCIVRVNAVDADAQALALTLNVSAGSLQPTTDPSVWILSI